MNSLSDFLPFFPMLSFNHIKQVLFQQKPQDKNELIKLLRDAQVRELLSAETFSMVEGALKVSDMHVRDVMIPRRQMDVLELNAPPDELVKKIVETGHSRFPVIGESRDDVQGIFLAKDLLEYYAKKNENHQFNMRDMMRPAVFIPESKRLNVLLREFRTSRNHIAIVVDEYSGVAGLVTIEDVIEEIIGEIDDEYDIDEQVFIHESKNGFYMVQALTHIEKFNDYFKTEFSDDEFDTIGGLVIQAFGHVPKRGETIELEGFNFEVIRADKRRIIWLRVKAPVSTEQKSGD